jgi:hypothetical protein
LTFYGEDDMVKTWEKQGPVENKVMDASKDRKHIE